MARDREQIYEASDWFKEALQKNQVCISAVNFDFVVYHDGVVTYMCRILIIVHAGTC